MQSPEEFVEEFLLEHADQFYDAQKAHEYYLRRRQLKGRHLVGKDVLKGRHGHSKVVVSKKHTAAQRRAAIQAKVAALKIRLETLRQVLAELVAKAKGRSGATTKHKTPVKNTKQTPHQKAVADKAAKAYYQKHKHDPKKLSPSAEAKALQAKIATVTKQIAKMRADLAAAKRKAGLHRGQ